VKINIGTTVYVNVKDRVCSFGPVFPLDQLEGIMVKKFFNKNRHASWGIHLMRQNLSQRLIE